MEVVYLTQIKIRQIYSAFYPFFLLADPKSPHNGTNCHSQQNKAKVKWIEGKVGSPSSLLPLLGMVSGSKCWVLVGFSMDFGVFGGNPHTYITIVGLGSKSQGSVGFKYYFWGLGTK